MEKKQEEVAVLLVDSARGQYCWKHLAEGYPLFKEDGSPISEEEKAGLMGEDWPEFATDLEGEIYVKEEGSDILWLVYQDEDIWAIHPRAEWSDEIEWFDFPNGDE